MPAKNIVKTYVENGIYHIYTRGVEKRIIFKNSHDYAVFLRILKDALSTPLDKNVDKTISLQGPTLQRVPRRPAKNFHGVISLLGYCLMPNHIHLLVKQTESRKIKEFMQSILTRYSMHFNKTYKRPGSLFQSRYKAAIVTDDPYLLALSRYIHRNPIVATKDLAGAYSSYSFYIGQKQAPWVDTTPILSYFQSDPVTKTKHTDYRSFVEWENKDAVLDAALTLEDEEE
jgi:hypothetical protein